MLVEFPPPAAVGQAAGRAGTLGADRLEPSKDFPRLPRPEMPPVTLQWCLSHFLSLGEER